MNVFDVLVAGVTAGGTGWTPGQLLVSLCLLPSLLACGVVLLLPPPRGEDGVRGSWRVLLRLGLAIWALILAAVVLSFGLVAPTWGSLFDTFGARAALPVLTRWLLEATGLITRLGWVTAPLTLLAEAAAPLASHVVLRRLRPDHDWLVVVAGGLALPLFVTTIGLVLYLPLIALSQAIGP